MAQDYYNWLKQLVDAPKMRAVYSAVEDNKQIIIDGSRGSSSNILAGSIAAQTDKLVLLVVAHLDEADDALDDLECFENYGYKLNSARFGALEVMPGESSVNIELLAERLDIVQKVSEGEKLDVIVAPIQALMQPVPTAVAAKGFSLTLKEQLELSPGELTDWLGNCGYKREDAIEQPGDFSVRGGIVDIYSPASTWAYKNGDSPVKKTDSAIRIDYFGDEIDSIKSIDLDTFASADNLQAVKLIGSSADKLQHDTHTTSLLELLPKNTVTVLHEIMELSEQGRGYYERLTNPIGIISPNKIFKDLTSQSKWQSTLQINQYSSSRLNSALNIELPLNSLIIFDTDAHLAINELIELTKNSDVVVTCANQSQRARLKELIETELKSACLPDNLHLVISNIQRGFVWDGALADGSKTLSANKKEPDSNLEAKPLIIISHHELFHRYQTKRRVRKVMGNLGSRSSDGFLDLEIGDYVVHVDHGIARFTGIKTMKASSGNSAKKRNEQNAKSQEYLTLEFAQKALLHVPATQIDLVQKYVGGFSGRPPLSALGGKKWQHQKDQVAQAVRQLAAELLRTQAARQTQPGICYPADTLWQKEFEAEFPYDETEDQLSAIAAVKHELSEPRPMDRLICGDVGFGKTEVAVRAAFKVAEYGKQVVILVPTTVLAEQHERTFKQRMADYPFRVESLSRFKTAKQQKKVIDELKAGRVDIIIATHRILSKDIKFADLGLVVIDEEQRFGVKHKQKLLNFRMTADVMTLTATPIPRTLHMSMVGLREISSLTSAPVDRRAIVTEVIPYDDSRIKQAIARELNRDGQIFFVHNRVHNIQSVANDLQALAPKARILVGHGQMPTRELEKVMLKFMRKEADILVSTTIIESGIDIPTANTMLINEADHFGLAELHQLRGRVGRYKNRAYCYLLLPKTRAINEVAVKRLKALEQYSMLGAGFKIAMRDLEIRGAGNLLGPQQSGHIAAVGYEMYCVLLERETKRLKNEKIVQPAKTHLKLPVTGNLDKGYIKSDKHRMDMYRRLSRASTFAELDEVAKSMEDAYGKPPKEAKNLIELSRIRIGAAALGIETIKLEKPDLIFKTRADSKVVDALKNSQGRVSVLDKHTIYYRPPESYLKDSKIIKILKDYLYASY